MRRLLVLALALLVALGATGQAQEPDPKGIQHGGFIRNGVNEMCWYTQIYEETNPHFMPPALQNTTHHDLRTITFNDPNCMASAHDDLNKMMINNAITRWFRGAYFVRDIEFDTQDILPPAALQARGNCLQSTNYPSKGIYVEYIMEAGNITGVAYMVALDSCTGSGPASRVEAPATPRPAQGRSDSVSVAEKLTVLETPGGATMTPLLRGSNSCWTGSSAPAQTLPKRSGWATSWCLSTRS